MNLFLKKYFLCLLLIGCNDTKVIFEDHKYISNPQGWHKDSSINFDINIQDTTHVYDIIVNLRNNNDYEFSNIYLFYYILHNDNIIKSDTLEYLMADVNGKWLGTGIGYTKNNPLSYLRFYNFKDTGNYTISIKQGMRKTFLKGINTVGIQIKNNNEEI